MRRRSTLPELVAVLTLLSVCAAGRSHAQTTIALEDFDGGAVNLLAGFNPATDNLDGGPGDWYGVAAIGTWPQGFPPGVPFSLVDDSVASVSNPLNPPFPADLEGVFGDGCNRSNAFFAVSDTRKWTGNNGETPLVASWTFDVSSGGDRPLWLEIDLGQHSNGASFSGITAARLLVEYSIDGGAFTTALSCDPFNATGSGFAYRPMDGGSVASAVSVLRAASPLTVIKRRAENGSTASNTILDKAPPASSSNPDRLDTFAVPLSGGGSASLLQIRITTWVDNEALAFDNIRIVAEDPEFVLGDANGDGALDFGDIEPFVLALLDPEAYALAYPGVNPNIVLDFDGDGEFTFGDIEGFVNALLG